MRIQSLLFGWHFVHVFSLSVQSREHWINVTTKLSVNAFESMHIFGMRDKTIVFRFFYSKNVCFLLCVCAFEWTDRTTDEQWASEFKRVELLSICKHRLKSAVKSVTLSGAKLSKNNGIFPTFVLECINLSFEAKRIFLNVHGKPGKSVAKWGTARSFSLQCNFGFPENCPNSTISEEKNIFRSIFWF